MLHRSRKSRADGTFLYSHLLAIFLLLQKLSFTLTLQVAVVPLISTSHIAAMDKITQQLIKRGHETITVFSNEPNQLKKIKPSRLALFDINQPITTDETQNLLSRKTTLGLFIGILQVNNRYCTAMLGNATVMQLLQNVDIIIGDTVNLCSILVPEVVKKPYILMSFSGTTIGMHTFFTADHPASYIPYPGSLYSCKMTFIQRMQNFIRKVTIENTMAILSSYFLNKLRARHNISLHLSLHEIQQKPSLHLATVDYAIEYPRPFASNIYAIGPITTQPTSPLPPLLEVFMQSSHVKGVIVLSLGSELRFTNEQLPELIKALGHIPHYILWKHYGTVDKLPSNVKVLEWIPQNDVLGHNSTIAFITHGGSHSMYEGAYHEVPMVAIPLMVEQVANAARIVAAGIGVYVDYHQFKAEDIIQAVKEVTTKKSYRESIARIARILKARKRSSRDQVVDWVEYVNLTQGSKHLRSEEAKLWFHQLYNLDVIILILAIMYAIYNLMRTILAFVKSKN